MRMYPTAALVVLLFPAASAHAQDPRDAVALDPTNHNVLLENEHVRVLEVMAAPGARSPMHTHPPLVAVSRGTSRLLLNDPDGSSVVFDLKPGQVVWLEDIEHSWEIVAGNHHVIAVEPKAAQPGAVQAATAPGPRDAVALDPTHHHVIMENDHVRVFEVLAAPGATSVLHTHPPLVAVSLSRARLRMAGPDGAPFIFDLYPGQALWMEDVQHSWELLAGQVHIIAVEVNRVETAATTSGAP